MSWSEFLKFLVSPNGIAAALGVVESILVEYIPSFKVLLPKWKRLIFYFVCLVVPVLSVAVGVFTLGWPADFQTTFWPAIGAGVVAFASGTLVHTRKL